MEKQIDSEKLYQAGLALYLAGKWSTDSVSKRDQQILWKSFRDALGLLEGTATTLGIGETNV